MDGSSRFLSCPSGFLKIQGCGETSGSAERSAAERRPAGSSPAALRVHRLAEGAAGGGGHVQNPLPQQAETNGVTPQ